MSFNAITSDIAPLPAIDDRRHALRDEPLCRESLVYTLQLPEERIAGWVYPRVTAQGSAGGFVCLFGDGLKNGPIFEILPEIEVPASMDFTDWQCGGVSLQLGEPLRTAHVKYQSDKLGYDFHFDALHPIYSYESHPDGCPKYFADNRTEQAGRIKGTITVEGRTIAFDSIGFRDHSWGARNWGVNYHYKWGHVANAECAVHFFKMEYLGRSLLRGYVFKDGHFSQLMAMEDIDFTLDADMVHDNLTFVAVDKAGRRTQISGKRFAYQPLPVDAKNLLNEVPLITQIDGRPGTGWCEMHWDTAYLAHMKQFPALRR